MILHQVHTEKGFTLIEMMITLAICSIMMGAIFTAFQKQQERYVIEDRVTAMQQSLRVAKFMLETDLRMAGYDPNDTFPTGTNGIANAGTNTITVNTFNDGTATIDNDVYTLDTTNDAQGNPRNQLQKDGVTIADGVSALGFAYAFDSDGNGIDTYTLTAGANAGETKVLWAINSGGSWFNLDVTEDGVIDANDDTDADGTIDGTDTAIVFNLAQIRAVRIWILAPLEGIARGFSNTTTYVVGNQVSTFNDNVQRRILTTTVDCRNLGI